MQTSSSSAQNQPIFTQPHPPSQALAQLRTFCAADQVLKQSLQGKQAELMDGLHYVCNI